MKIVTSDQNPTLRQAIRLHESRGRRQQQRIIIFGESEIRLAQRSGVSFSEIFVCQEKLDDVDGQLLNALQSQQVPIISLKSELFRKLAFGDRQDPIVATAKRPENSLEDIVPKTNELVVVIEAIEKPGNLGAIFRSCDAAGVDAVLIADVRCDAFHPNAIRASLGAVFSIPSASGPSHAVRDFLVDQQFQIAAAKVGAATMYFEIDLTGKTAIVLGSEHAGLSEIWNASPIVDVNIPMLGQVDSLNVSVSASILLFEAQRQRCRQRDSKSAETS